jgi:hypothetical protein
MKYSIIEASILLILIDDYFYSFILLIDEIIYDLHDTDFFFSS